MKRALAGVLLLVFSGVSCVVAASSERLPHAPIHINGNQDLVPENGVTGGTGTPDDPFVIEGWSLSGGPEVGISVESTSADLVVRDCSFIGFHSQPFWAPAVNLDGVVSAVIESCEFNANDTALAITGCDRITIRGCSFSLLRDGRGIAVDRSSSVSIAECLLVGDGVSGSYDWGISVWNSSEPSSVQITRSTFRSLSAGISIGAHGVEASILENSFSDITACPIRLVELKCSTCPDLGPITSSVTITRNNFLGPGAQPKDSSLLQGSQGDSRQSGNYWQYRGWDGNGDGVCDPLSGVPYFGMRGIDWYPEVRPWQPSVAIRGACFTCSSQSVTLVNWSGASVSLAGWHVQALDKPSDAVLAALALPDLTLEPGATLRIVVGNHAPAEALGVPTVAWSPSLPLWSSGGGLVQLLDPSSQIIDRYSHDGMTTR